MSVQLNGDNISITRGDTLILNISITKNNDAYTPNSGDKVRFALKRTLRDAEPIIIKDIDTSTMRLILESSDTKALEPGSYKYDIELTTVDGYVDTFIGPATFKITEEVY